MQRREEENAVTEFALVLGLLMRRLRSTTPSELHELSWSQMAVITRLAKEGPATTAELARAEGVKPQSMGSTIAVLENMGLVERKPHPTDGRQMNIALTPKGAAMRKSAREAKHSWLAQAVAQLSERERVTLFAAGDIIKRLVEL